MGILRVTASALPRCAVQSRSRCCHPCAHNGGIGAGLGGGNGQVLLLLALRRFRAGCWARPIGRCCQFERERRYAVLAGIFHVLDQFIKEQ